ncbi:MAG TPA: hypothetical protein VNH46_00790, partial [Gemmatimonadales bacterium]|nr:hypothetical protein [Gemmatimonadales bacterium]
AIRSARTLRFTVRWHGPSGDTLLYATAPRDSLRAVPRFHLTPAGNGALFLTGLMAPFPVIRLDPVTGAREEFAAPLAGRDHAVASDSLRHWRALPAVAVDCAVLLTLADLTSERRLLVRYSPEGRVDQVIQVDAPLGLMARVPGADVVLAARRAGALELVWYDWRWVREPGPPSP